MSWFCTSDACIYACLYSCIFRYTCICKCVWMYTSMWRSEDNLRECSQASPAYVLDKVSHFPRPCHRGETGWPVSPKESPYSASLVLGF